MSTTNLFPRHALLALLASLLAACAAPTSDEKSDATGEALGGIPYFSSEFPESGVGTNVAVAYQPGLVSQATDLFYGDVQGHLVWKHYDNTVKWLAGRNVPVNCSVNGQPSVALTDVNEWRVFYPCSDRSFWYVNYIGYNWQAPQMICPAGCIAANTGVSTIYDRFADLWRTYFVGTNNHVYETSHPSGAQWWSGGHDTGAIAAGSPFATLRRSNHQVNVFYRGTNNDLFDVWFDGSNWHAPWDHGFAFSGDPSAVVSSNDAEIDVYFTTLWSLNAGPQLASSTWTSYYGWGGLATHGLFMSHAGARKANDVFGMDGNLHLAEDFASSL